MHSHERLTQIHYSSEFSSRKLALAGLCDTAQFGAIVSRAGDGGNLQYANDDEADALTRGATSGYGIVPFAKRYRVVLLPEMGSYGAYGEAQGDCGARDAHCQAHKRHVGHKLAVPLEVLVAVEPPLQDHGSRTKSR